MFFRKKPKDDDDNELAGMFVDEGVASGIKRALQRTDLTPEDRKDLEDALKRLSLKKEDAED
jgi:hypothetical protein